MPFLSLTIIQTAGSHLSRPMGESSKMVPTLIENCERGCFARHFHRRQSERGGTSARRVKQFGVEFYQAGLSAKDIDRLVKFEVLGYSGGPNDDGTPKGKKTKPSRARVNWDSLERRISESEAAYQRPVIRRKIDELVAYYRECKDAGTLPPIPGAVIITSEKRFTFTPVGGHHDIGLLQIPEEHGVLRVLDGQHRLLALHALSQAGEQLGLDVPAVLFHPLDARQTVEPFGTT